MSRGNFLEKAPGVCRLADNLEKGVLQKDKYEVNMPSKPLTFIIELLM